jgi:hypothetical protein
MLTVLIIGGYGTFGGRLCDLLADEPRLTLIVAGRSLAKAETFCRRPSRARLVAARFDRSADVAAQVTALKPDIVVDASGPFQAYGDDLYAVVKAAFAERADYIDLADSPAFVRGIGAHDDAGRQAGCFALAGASSFPVLTSAAVRELAAGLACVDKIVAGIAPSPHASVGMNVIRAIASYAGQPVELTRGGVKTTALGLVDSQTRTISVPGRAPLRPTRFALVEVPDLTLLADVWPEVQEVWMGAGPTPALLHRVLWAAAQLVHWRILPSLVPIAPLMNWVTNHVRWGPHRGGMFVEVAGVDGAGVPVIRRWHMIAEGDSGPLIPSMAVEIIVRRCLDGERPMPGARPCDKEIALADYECAFFARGIASAVVPV